ncbi:MAG: BTAD domain-containing putative transcriptional regulator [Geminicoccaceae bacterium]
MIYFHVLGRVEVFDHKTLSKVNIDRQPLMILAFLSLHRNCPHGRETIIEMFWPNCDPAKGRSRLSSSMTRLRQSLAVPLDNVVFDNQGGVVSLASDASITTDVEEFERRIRPYVTTDPEPLDETGAADLRDILQLYRGDLLAGEYYSWLLNRREVLLSLFIRGRLRLMSYFAEHGELDDAIECGRAVLAVDPLRENLQARRSACSSPMANLLPPFVNTNISNTCSPRNSVLNPWLRPRPPLRKCASSGPLSAMVYRSISGRSASHRRRRHFGLNLTINGAPSVLV